MVGIFLSALAIMQAGPSALPVRKIVGFDCKDEGTAARRRVNIDLSDHLWQDEDGNWYKIAAEYANSLTLMDVTSDNGSKRKLDFDRFKLALNESQYIAPANTFFSQHYVCRIGPPIDMTAGRKF